MIDPLDAYLTSFKPTGQLENDVKILLLQHDQEHTYHHVKAVAKKALELAEVFQGDAEKCRIAAWLHDISTIVPNDERIALAKALNVEVLAEEKTLPMIIHQKLSAVFAKQVFNIHDEEILSAISCHTTLKANATLTDKIVFTADKIAWDQIGSPPYIKALNEGLERSIDDAALAYINYLWDIQGQLVVLHPWVKEARVDLLA